MTFWRRKKKEAPPPAPKKSNPLYDQRVFEKASLGCSQNVPFGRGGAGVAFAGTHCPLNTADIGYTWCWAQAGATDRTPPMHALTGIPAHRLRPLMHVVGMGREQGGHSRQ